jgi:battenin
VITASSYSETTALTGVVVAAFSAGAGEATILNFSLGHEKYVISAYTSGLGAAAILSSGVYLCSMIFFTTQTALLIMVIVPFIMYITFAMVIQNPKAAKSDERATGGDQESACSQDKAHIMQKSFLENGIDLLQSAPLMLLPIFLTTFLRSLIVQGLLELVHPRDTAGNSDATFRYFNTLANLGIFMSQSSVSLYSIQRLWILPCFQILILILVLVQILLPSPSFYIVACLSLAAGLVGGAAVVNTYYRIRQDIPPERQALHMEAAIFANELASAVAGLVSIPSHSFICGIISSIRQ